LIKQNRIGTGKTHMGTGIGTGIGTDLELIRNWEIASTSAELSRAELD
jgi:hypothetical protein